MLAAVTLPGCTATEESSVMAPASSPVINSTCSDISETVGNLTIPFFNTKTDCETTTHANCFSEPKVLPDGSVPNCFRYVDGGQNCLNLVPQPTLIYTLGTAWCRTANSPPSIGTPYYRLRSLFSCSGDPICKCLDDPLLYDTTLACTDINSCDPVPSGTISCCPGLSSSTCN